ncbi:hypothetical protein C8A03DRAFT_33880 [Achaetomium macrosporum]|uniref:Uncharacterized protein n=1 Tax=Achaetomium macrosporum TaxID=79813 RepID=A0AAN7C9Z4_9PEZI|nr:hypothetical protein C8A03DRAFT_33880 [Achaetomium macrosporum]
MAQTARASPPSELINLIDRWLDATRHDPRPPAGNQSLVASRPALYLAPVASKNSKERNEWYEVSGKHDWIKKSWRVHDWRLRPWKEEMVGAVEAWATKHCVVIHAGYSGGSIKARKDRDQDSVEMAAGWLHNVVTRMEKTIPGVEEEYDWQWKKLCFFKRLESFGTLAEEEEDDDDDDAMDLDN